MEWPLRGQETMVICPHGYIQRDRVVIVLITHPFICLFICVTHFLATYYLPDSVLGIGHGTVKKIDKVLFFRECLFLKRDIDNNK